MIKTTNQSKGGRNCRALLMALLFMLTCGLSAQTNKTIAGKVTSSDDGSPLSGVTILVKGAGTGEVTDFDGKYALTYSGDSPTLVFSYIGYLSQEITISGEQSLDVVLAVDNVSLDEIVVVGYGEQSRATLTTSVAKLDAQVIENTVFANAASALQGTLSGVRVQTLSGQPGAEPRVIVRGGASINNPNGAEPLYIVDGVIRQDLAGINSADIESIQVLKDAAATAIYGARAANGVVIVALKKGRSGKTVVSYNYTQGYSKLREKYDVLNARDFIFYNRLGVAAIGEKHPERLTGLDQPRGEGIGNDLTNNTAYTTQYLTPENEFKLNEGWESIPDPLDPSKTIIFQGTDWQDVLFQTGVTKDHYLSLSGGDDKATFNMGVGYTDVEGVAIMTDYSRWTANINGRLQVRPKLYVFGGLNYTRESDNKVFSENQLFERSVATPPTAKFRYEDGTLAPGAGRSIGNPLYHLGTTVGNNQDNRLTLSGGASWEFLPNLVFEPSASLFNISTDGGSFQKAYYNSPTQFIDSRDASAFFQKLDQQQIDATVTYTKSIDNAHNFQGKLGFAYFRRINSSIAATGKGAATDLITTLNAAGEPVSVSSESSEQIILGYFGRFNYDYKQKYLLSFNARYDGASNLGDENKWGFFPGISTGWNVHKEDFWTAPLKISSLKLRASYGVNGNLGNLGDFTAQGRYSVGSTYDGVAAVEYTGIANQALQWEQSKTFDVGFDLGIFNDRVVILFDYYRRVTDNLITTLALPKSTGFGSILTNLGSLENKGVELEVSAEILRQNDFSWTLSFNASKNTNTILELPENDNENNRIGGYQVYDPAAGELVWRGGLQEGAQIGELYAYNQLSVYATDEEAAAGPVDQIVAGADKSKFGGDINWEDVNGDGIIDSKDRVRVGNIYPTWTGGISTSAAYKRLSLYARMDYITGHSIYNYVRTAMNGGFQGNQNNTTEILDSWLEQGDVTDVPRYYWIDQAAQTNYWRGDPRNLDNGRGRSLDYEKGDYLALREITLSYTLPEQWLAKAGVSNVRLNVTGNNLKYFTGYKGLVPEDGGADRGRYPVPKSVIFGLKVSF